MNVGGRACCFAAPGDPGADFWSFLAAGLWTDLDLLLPGLWAAGFFEATEDDFGAGMEWEDMF